MIRRLSLLALAVSALASAPTAHADEALVAVAANFAEAAKRLERRFEETTPHAVTFTVGSTGKLYAQIVNGAPFDVFLAADQARPERLAKEGHADADSRFTYAIGQLVVWSADPTRAAPSLEAALDADTLRFVAIANPELAPYGAAARQVLEGLNRWDALQAKIVMGENIGQTHAMVASGNADLGFVALSQVSDPDKPTPGTTWEVPITLYDPIRQDAVLLAHGRDNASARAFIDFLRSAEARAVIARFGYATE